MAGRIPGFTLGDRIGKGGSAVVYRARDEHLGRTVALKIILEPLDDDPIRRRFLRECRTLGELSGRANIVTVHHAGVTEQNIGFIVMPLYGGGSLAQRVQEHGPLTVDETVQVGLRLSEALAFAHGLKVWHRDVKPENVLLTEDGAPVLTDFGVAVALAEGGLTTSTAFSLWHAAPEVLRGTADPLDGRRADVYSLGSTLYTALCGEPAFRLGSELDQLAAAERGWTDLPRGDVPAALADVLRRAMQPDPGRRFEDVRDLADALLAAGRPPVVTQPPRDARPAGPVAPSDGPPDLPGLEFLRTLGSGGFGDVHLYRDHELHRDVAVKVPRPAAPGENPADLLDVQAAQLQHQHIAKVFTVLVAQDGRRCLVMEYHPGPTLEARAARGPLPVEEVLRIGIQLCGAVEVAHRSGVVHRDIKPANVLTDGVGTPYLADFGIARRVGTGVRPDDPLSLQWTAPEVLRGTADSTPAQDVYSLGATLWHLLGGRPPFPVGVDQAVAVERVLLGQPEPLAHVDVPDRLRSLLLRAMVVTPQDRTMSAWTLARSLQEVQRALGLTVTEPLVPERLRPDAATTGSTEADVMTAVPVVPTSPVRSGGAAVRPTSEGLPDFEFRPDRAGAPGATALPGATASSTDLPVAVTEGPGVNAQPGAGAGSRTGALVTVGSLLLVAAAGVGLVVATRGGADDTPDAGAATTTARAQDVLAGDPVPAPVAGRVTTSAGRVRFTWSVRTPDAVAYYVVTPGGGATPARVEATAYETASGGEGQTCVTVVSYASDGGHSGPTRMCG